MLVEELVQRSTRIRNRLRFEEVELGKDVNNVDLVIDPDIFLADLLEFFVKIFNFLSFTLFFHLRSIVWHGSWRKESKSIILCTSLART